jgi:hypothetical protein
MLAPRALDISHERRGRDGWVEGQNITFEYRFGNADVLPKLAAGSAVLHRPRC